MLNHRKNAKSGRRGLLCAALAAGLAAPAAALPLDATDLLSGPTSWIFRVDSHTSGSLSESWMKLGTPGFSEKTESFEDGCPSGDPACPALDFQLAISDDLDADDTTWNIILGGGDNTVVKGALVSDFYSPTGISGPFSQFWSVSSPALPGLLTGKLTLDAAPALASSAAITLDPFPIRVKKSGGAEDTVDFELSTGFQAPHLPFGAFCQGLAFPGVLGTALDLTTGALTLIDRECLVDNVDEDPLNIDFVDDDGSNGEYLTFRVSGTVVAPEPGTLLLTGLGLLGLGYAGRPRKI